ncbi:F-box and leucine-rich repeat protein 13-like [Lycorma delicatula]|uniref:F-box and leucine-rich repeat protein 13-like n=1 Tax=Lycorma delicatula TaxID=130591 RepID=UPI003F518AFE
MAFNLPNELLLKIFSYLDVFDVAFSVSNVCQLWNNLSYDPILWNSFILICDKYMDLNYIIDDVLPKMFLLRRVQLQWRTDTDVIINKLIECCKNIKELEFICCGYLSDDTIKQLSINYPNLISLNLGKCWRFPDKCYKDVVLFNNLINLSVSHCFNLNGVLLRQISDRCLKLTTLNIDYIRGISEDDILYFITPRISNLISLTLFGDCLTDRILFEISKCKRLKTLHISSCQNISDIGLNLILSNMHTLTSLTLRKTVKFTTANLAHFFFKSSTCMKLTHLYISSKRNFTKQQLFDLFPLPYSDFYDQKLCTLILTLNGFQLTSVGISDYE